MPFQEAPLTRPAPIDHSGLNAYFNHMSKLEIVKVPDPILRETSTPVEMVNADVRRLMDDMLETMYDAPGVGLAAIQVGVPRRVIVLDVSTDEEEAQPFFMANPEIVYRGKTMRTHEEGCLSIPDVNVEIERPADVTVRYVDRDGAAQELTADGFLATVIQHEVDHLDGKLIIDFLSRLRRDMIIRKFKKQQRPALF